MENEVKSHGVRPRDIINLAAPSSWAASVMPSVLAIVLTYRSTGRLDYLMAICLFVIAILMQSSVNALNDYMDFIKGTDNLDNSPDASDAVIVYGLSPKAARNTGIIFLLLAFLVGIYCVLQCGYIPLVIGAIGALVIVCYSAGKLPISYLPIGELVSGFVMGGLITLAGFYMQTRNLDFYVLLKAIPVIFGIGMIMFSNNGCDIEKDIPVGRHTLACILGRPGTDILYRVLGEAFRLLKPNGYFMCIDSFVPESPVIRPFYNLYFNLLMPFIGGGIHKHRQYKWLSKSTKSFISAGELEGLMKKKGFCKIRSGGFLFGACVCIMGNKKKIERADNDK